MLGCAYLKVPGSLLFILILFLGVAIPLTTAEYLPNQTAGVTNPSNLQTCAPIEAGTLLTFYPCSATIPDRAVVLLLILFAAVAIISTELLVVHKGKHV